MPGPVRKLHESRLLAMPDGRRVARLRAIRKWTQQRLADESEVSKGTIENIEKGIRIRYTSLSVVANALGVNVESLIQGADAAESQTTGSEPKKFSVKLVVGPELGSYPTEVKAEVMAALLEIGLKFKVVEVIFGSVILRLEM